MQYKSDGQKGSNFLCLPILFSTGQLFKERICSSGSKFFPLRVDSISKSNLIQRSKQEFMQLNIALFSEKKSREHLLEQGHSLGLIGYVHTEPEKTSHG